MCRQLTTNGTPHSPCIARLNTSLSNPRGLIERHKRFSGCSTSVSAQGREIIAVDFSESVTTCSQRDNISRLQPFHFLQIHFKAVERVRQKTSRARCILCRYIHTTSREGSDGPPQCVTLTCPPSWIPLGMLTLPTRNTSA
jgi:hypothetical protein